MKTGGNWVGSNSVKVIDEGFLTSYPWKIEGTLEVPFTHAYQQYAGGNLEAKVWIEFTSEGIKDDETEAYANAYLLTNNQLAMIQTGDQNGKATDDERKIIANTLFYLKQLSNVTEMTDHSAYDMAAPSVCEISEAVRVEDKINLSVSATDYGTDYQYYVEAVKNGTDREGEKKNSNIVTVTSLSGIAGYKAVINDTTDVLSEDAYTNTYYEEDGKVSIEYADDEEDAVRYLHIRAVDNAGNVSEETVIEVPQSKKEAVDYFNTGYSIYGSEDITVYCSELMTGQSIYSGGNFTFGGSKIAVNSMCQAVGSIFTYAGDVSISEKIEQSESVRMPQLHEIIVENMSKTETMEVLEAYNSTAVDVPTYCMSTTGAYCPELAINKSLVCESDINIGTGNINCGQEENAVLYSVNGNISINASAMSGKGLIYAPNGTVTINIQNFEFAGSIIAKKVVLQGSVFNINR